MAQGRADWGVAIESVALAGGLVFLPLREEHFDFVVHRSRASRPGVQAFRQLLQDAQVQGTNGLTAKAIRMAQSPIVAGVKASGVPPRGRPV